jgi:hypothetical protein
MTHRDQGNRNYKEQASEIQNPVRTLDSHVNAPPTGSATYHYRRRFASHFSKAGRNDTTAFPTITIISPMPTRITTTYSVTVSLPLLAAGHPPFRLSGGFAI